MPIGLYRVKGFIYRFVCYLAILTGYDIIRKFSHQSLKDQGWVMAQVVL